MAYNIVLERQIIGICIRGVAYIDKECTNKGKDGKKMADYKKDPTALEPYEVRRKIMDEIITVMNQAAEKGYQTLHKEKKAG